MDTDLLKQLCIFLAFFGLSDVFLEKTKVNKLLYYIIILLIALLL
jgi:hypothetical protein